MKSKDIERSNLFKRIELGAESYDVIVNTRFGITLCSVSGDFIFYSQPIESVRIREVNNLDRKKSSLKRSPVGGTRRM